MSKQGGSLEYEYQSDFESAKHGEIVYVENYFGEKQWTTKKRR